MVSPSFVVHSRSWRRAVVSLWLATWHMARLPPSEPNSRSSSSWRRRASMSVSDIGVEPFVEDASGALGWALGEREVGGDLGIAGVEADDGRGDARDALELRRGLGEGRRALRPRQGAGHDVAEASHLVERRWGI